MHAVNLFFLLIQFHPQLMLGASPSIKRAKCFDTSREFVFQSKEKDGIEVKLFDKNKKQKRIVAIVKPFLPKLEKNDAKCECLTVKVQKLRFEPREKRSDLLAVVLVTDRGEVYAKNTIYKKRFIEGKRQSIEFPQGSFKFPLIGDAMGTGKLSFTYKTKQKRVLVHNLHGTLKVSVKMMGMQMEEVDSATLTKESLLLDGKTCDD